MGTHDDYGITVALHRWKVRAIRAERELADHKGEELLRAVIEELDTRLDISIDLEDRIKAHLKGEDV